MVENRLKLVSVGGTFDVIAGRVNRAPPLFLRLNLEWFYRLMREPRRVWRQRALVKFAWCVVQRRFAR